jgi:mono/diheme cytochrome c family protein
MKLLLKLVLALVVIVLIVAGAGVAYLYAKYPDVPPPDNVTVVSTPEKVTRGEYLANHVSGCVICHAEPDRTKYGVVVKPGTAGAGGEFFGDEAQGLAVYSKNITPSAIGNWTDGELIRAFTAGVSKDGTPLFPIMPYPRFGRLSREDVEAIVAYIRTLKPVEHTVPDRRLPFPLPFVVRTIPAPAAFRPIPPKTNKVAYGEYMVNAAVCADCHTPIDDMGTPLPGREFSGGTEFKPAGGGTVRSANITPDADSGIGTWTEQQFIEKFQAWRGAEPRTLTPADQHENTVMPWAPYSGMTDEDLAAIYAYLRTLKPVLNRVKKFN